MVTVIVNNEYNHSDLVFVNLFKGGVHPFLFGNIDFEIAVVRGRCAQYGTFETKFGRKFHSGAAWGAAASQGAKISI